MCAAGARDEGGVSLELLELGAEKASIKS